MKQTQTKGEKKSGNAVNGWEVYHRISLMQSNVTRRFAFTSEWRKHAPERGGWIELQPPCSLS